MQLRKLISMSVIAASTISLSGCLNATNPTLSFNSNGGSKIEALSEKANSSIKAPEDPTKKGYEFAGWYKDSSFKEKFDFTTMPSSNTTVYAKWNLLTFSIEYVLNGGTNSSNNPGTYNVLTNNFKLKEATKDDYIFAGWYTDANYSNVISQIETDAETNYVLYAKWATEQEEIIVDYNVIYHLDGGVNGNNPTTFNKNTVTIQLEDATKEGYEFLGWYSDETYTKNVVSIDTSIEANINVYAKFEENNENPPVVETSYNINYHLNGATNASANPMRYTESMGSVTLEDPIKLSCTFKGWYSDEEFTTPITTIDCSLKQEVDVYAKWVNGISVVTYEFDFGLEQDYTLYHVSDTHINSINTEADYKNELSRMTSRFDYANQFGEKYDEKYLAPTSTENFQAIISYLNEEKPTAVCFTGDIMDSYSIANYNFIYEEISKTSVPFTYSLGNHEPNPSEFENMSGIDSTPFTMLDFGTFKIISLDNSNNTGEGEYYYTQAQYDLLKAEIDKNVPIILAEHIPLLTRENCETRLEECGEYFYIDEYSCDSITKKMVDLICNSDAIKLILCGHIHGGTMSYVAPGKPQITCSSSLTGVINQIVIH